MHGLAPIAAAMDINRGDRFTTLSATATAPKGLADYRERFVPRDHRSWNEKYINGDLVTCMLNTAKGRVIRAEHNVSQPRPYSRINTLDGSRGIFEDYVGGDATGARIYFEPDHSGDTWRGSSALRSGVRPLAVEGSRGPRPAAATAAWTTSCSGASSSRCAPDWCPTSTCTTRRPGARRFRSA